MKKEQVQESMTPFLQFAVYVVGYHSELLRLGMDAEGALRLTQAFQHDLLVANSAQRPPQPDQEA